MRARHTTCKGVGTYKCARGAREREDETANPDAAADNAPASLRSAKGKKLSVLLLWEISRFDGKFAAV